MKTKMIFKDQFSVIGKMGQGAGPGEWILNLWKEFDGALNEIKDIIKYDNNNISGVWGAMNDNTESNKRWDENGGKYMAGCEADNDVIPPEGWTKWSIPAQTYLVVKSTQETYGDIFQKITNDENITIVGSQHEFYPEPQNPDNVELYFPIAKGNIICQSCGMPMFKDSDFGKEADESMNPDYCHYCYEKGAFTNEETMEEMIESCIPFEIEAGVYENTDEARKDMMIKYPQMKRWAAGEV